MISWWILWKLNAIPLTPFPLEKFEQISKGNIDNSHLVALTLDSKEILEAENTLKEMFIPFIRNDVPFFEQD
ncbi:hypothetical protein [Peptostreptococcus porci]|uniref:hypothetical protein n=1 Tax=Peptostreptococcus porci TaxID=2652282 RepID=UPI002A913E2C|nr:hypothetical protein [Peptostreptococcus porci]